MKKLIIYILILVAIVIAVFMGKYMKYKAEKGLLKEYNLQYESCLNKEILGNELTTFINIAVDNNERNKIKKDDNGFYIQDDINSIEIEINMIDNDTTYKMETLYNGGMTTFLSYYNSIYFECTNIEYNNKGKVNYVLFEQKTN